MVQPRDKSEADSLKPDLSHLGLSHAEPSQPKLQLTDFSSPSLPKTASSDTYLFISDLHLCASRPHITIAFLDFLETTALKAKALYILGDLFEYWAGDDDIDDAFHQQIILAFKTLANTGVQLFLMHGNRDFLISQRFCTAAKITLLNDPTLVVLHGKKALLCHGDDLCTDDTAYQNFRLQVRDKNWQKEFLSQSLETRKKQIVSIRTHSEQEKSQKSAQIMDVNSDAVNALLQAYHYPELLIHGHTHRPNQHQIQLDGHDMTRWVLGDWYEQGSYLSCDQYGCQDIRL
ncbi:MAG: UDP-2,3-diacylglucosamine diphosphatase [Methylotenera sp.]|nr:UDP-2,3-diacylglucosamine diphosphatase [Methylotenera sp.]MDO9231995.1 UDP-2,3-diacylglucosamine diphosphatase [Methylotenera sp.]MDO9389522.1 UDP-2,3-diacylglucosamine diphosphatase [Methylotenera sp.]MDP1596644.1 UDP-2,3-diacylglucosamine diphosphatase [Methylotenera sp.]MDP1755437.1 UDP-2,3-diacylglucosamine diphosphatase [Methylotenera sp.]